MYMGYRRYSDGAGIGEASNPLASSVAALKKNEEILEELRKRSYEYQQNFG